ncbi:GF23890, related [Neospora caninum Liverpool]|uniref:GF23890, related n=1 Tax=Neospora caninum (strain Liverpool) TaxID=572307 RepID=F0VIL9_NEOCL|nr:GF23890, related [Neospora caninum Liverpool]CBZ53580.1 GF23890, related [Neospora caninum Liverpool]|eukprot:XP_003883612.1 GF23890, related [Neospora caninum Liverpool]
MACAGGLSGCKGTNSSSSGVSTDRYDRQIRIWGEHGQSELSAASVLVLGSSAAAGDVLKNLVLPGIRRFVIVDDAQVTQSDLHNTMLNPADLGEPRAASMVRQLLELNTDVEGAAVHLSPAAYVAACETACETAGAAAVDNACVRRVQGCASSDPQGRDASRTGPANPGEFERALPCIFSFSVVIACQQPLDLVLRLSQLCGLEPVESRASPDPLSVPHSSLRNGAGFADATAAGVPETLPAGTEKTVSYNGHGCRRGRVPLITVTSVGLLGLVRVCAGECCLVERKGQSEGSVDLRLFDSFPELYEFAMEYELDRLDDLAHAQVPFVVILIQALDRYRRTHRNASSDSCDASTVKEPRLTPLPQEARGQLEAIIQGMRRHPDEVNFDEALANVYRILKPHSVSPDTAEVIEQASSPSFRPVSNVKFWTLARALAAFQRACKKLPVQGLLPDMTSDTQSFIRLQQVYSKRAEGDCNAIKASVSMIQGDSVNHDGDVQGRIPGGVTDSPTSSAPVHCSQETLRGSMDSSLRRRASERNGVSFDDVEKFCRNAYNLKVIRYRSLGEEFNPATVNREVYEEAVAGLQMEESDEGIPLLPCQMVAFGGAEIHTTAAIVGGVAAQEAVKLICRQFEPINNTFIWSGIERKAEVLEL